MEPGTQTNSKERLMNHSGVRRLLHTLLLAENGFFLAEVSSTEDAQQILDIVQGEIPKQTGLPIDIVKYIPRVDPDYDTMDNDTRYGEINYPFRQWIKEIRIPQEDDAEKTRLFVIDGSGIGNGDRATLVDHFAFMNALRGSVVGNKRGPVLVFIPKNLEIEKDIEKYGDLMTCCSMRLHIEG